MSREWPKGPTEPIIQEFNKSEITTTRLDSKSLHRPEMSEEGQERLEQELMALGNLMGGSNLWWQLDGTLTTSLRQKELGRDYIGAHSDIDMSVLRKELPDLEKYLQERGYGLFLISRDGGKRIFRRIGHQSFAGRFLDGVRESPYIAAIDGNGNLRTDADLVRIQIAIVDVDADGIPSERGVSYPKSWLEGKAIDLNGTPIILSHPARHLFWKIWHTRGYDDSDIRLIAEMNLLTKEELDTLEKIVLSKAADAKWWEENRHFVKDEELLRSRLATLRRYQTEKN